MAGQEDLDVVPVEVPTVEVKLFGKWSSDDVHVNDISLAVSLEIASPGGRRLKVCSLCTCTR